MSDETARLADRNGEIWRLYCRGVKQVELAERFSLTQATVSNIIKQVRDSIPEETRLEIVKREVDFLDDLRDEVAKLFYADLPPAFDRDGSALQDPETQEYIRDMTGRLNALQGLLKVMDRHHKLLGLEAPTRIDATVTGDEDLAAKTLAAEAARRLAGQSDG